MALENLIRDPHLTDDEIYLLFEGEQASARPSAASREHLERCWSCQQRLKRVEDAVAAFVDDRDVRYSAERRPPPGRWMTFRSRLREQTQTWRRENASREQRRAAVAAKGIRWAIGAAAAAALVFLFLPARTVAASEALERSVAAERVPGGLSRPLLYQKIRVESPAGTALCEVWSAPSDRRMEERWTGPAAVGEQLAGMYRKNRFDTAIPLSAAHHTRWRSAAGRIEDKLTGLRSEGLLRVSTRRLGPAQAGDIIEATLVIRQSDWRAVAQEFRVQAERGESEYRLAQMEYRVEPFSTEAWNRIFPPAALPEVVPPAVAPVPPVQAPAARVDLDASEMRVLEALRRTGLDIAADIELRRAGQNLEVMVLACPPELCSAIGPALAGIPGVELRSPAVSQRAAATAEVQGESGTPEPPLLLQRMVEVLGSEQAAQARVAEINSEFARARAHALALARLRASASDRSHAWLERPDLRPALDNLGRSHVSAIRDSILAIERLVMPVMNDAPAPEAAARGCALWDSTLDSLSGAISETQSISDRLFAVTVSNGGQTDASAGRLQARLAGIRASVEDCIR